MIGPNKLVLYYTWLERRHKPSSLLGPFVSYEENEVLVDAAPGIVFKTLYLTRNLHLGQKGRLLDYSRPWRFANDKHSSLLDQFISYEEIEMFVNKAHGTVFTTLHFLWNLHLGPKGRLLDYSRPWRLASDKHSSLLDQFIRYEVFVNKAPGIRIHNTHFLRNLHLGLIR